MPAEINPPKLQHRYTLRSGKRDALALPDQRKFTVEPLRPLNAVT